MFETLSFQSVVSQSNKTIWEILGHEEFPVSPRPTQNKVHFNKLPNGWHIQCSLKNAALNNSISKCGQWQYPQFTNAKMCSNRSKTMQILTEGYLTSKFLGFFLNHVNLSLEEGIHILFYEKLMKAFKPEPQSSCLNYFSKKTTPSGGFITSEAFHAN